MTTQAHAPATVQVAHVGRHAAWFVFGNVVAFAIPYLGVSVLDLQHDVFYALYFATVLALLGGYARVEYVDLRAMFTRDWIWSVAIGAVIAVAIARNVLANSDATPRPHGGYFVFEVLWRGVGYGVIDALLLTAFPCAIAYALLHEHVSGLRAHLRFIALGLPLIMVITATYHLGYPQIRQDGIGRPETGNTLISVPTLLTANPIGSIGAHITMHITAVTHAYQTRDYLPPQTFVGSK
ncbi:MAG TPA: hypothetical protein VHS27_18385 [Gaiellales bacterium]|jgi:hypothetical protein|nr:hypothetical protein [Gaiellales bacterium]